MRKQNLGFNKVILSIKSIFSNLWFAFVLGVLGVSLLGALKGVSQPAAINACIPRQQVSKTELLSTTQLSGTTYYLFNAYELNDTQGAELIISLNNNRCRKVFYNPMGDSIALASVVPQSVARQLTLGRYRRELNRIGKSAFQQQINQSAGTGNTTWFDEQIWALRQLGITVPKNVRVGS